MCDQLLAEAPTHTGSSQFDTQLQIGQALAITDATDEARHVLATVAHVSTGNGLIELDQLPE